MVHATPDGGPARAYSSAMDPDKRIGDAERDAAVESLRDHHVAGRLTPEEFTERMEAALRARTRADLDPLFVDLPETPAAAPQPQGGAMERAPQNRQAARTDSGYHRLVGILSAIAWPAALIFNFATGWNWWWVILIPMFLVPALVGEDHEYRKATHRHH